MVCYTGIAISTALIIDIIVWIFGFLSISRYWNINVMLKSNWNYLNTQFTLVLVNLLTVKNTIGNVLEKWEVGILLIVSFPSILWLNNPARDTSYGVQ